MNTFAYTSLIIILIFIAFPLMSSHSCLILTICVSYFLISLARDKQNKTKHSVHKIQISFKSRNTLITWWTGHNSSVYTWNFYILREADKIITIKGNECCIKNKYQKKKWPNLDLLWEHVNFNVLISRNNSIEMMWKWRITKKVTRRTATCVTSPLIIQNLDGDWTLSLEELKKQASESDWHRLESQSLHLSAMLLWTSYLMSISLVSSDVN